MKHIQAQSGQALKFCNEIIDFSFQWYRTDFNAVPPMSILQPIDTYLVHFLNKRVPKLQARDSGIWWGTLAKMQQMLRKASHTLYVNGKMTHEQVRVHSHR